jgi:hypothetical protein
MLSHTNIIRNRQKPCKRLITDMYWLLKMKFPSLIVVDRRVCENCEKNFVMSVYLSIKPHGTTRLPLNEFSPNLMFYSFSKIC